MAKVALVTDSTSYIPKGVREKYPITVVPQVVIWEGQTYEDDVTITPEQFYTRLRTAKVMPSTSQASTQWRSDSTTMARTTGCDKLSAFPQPVNVIPFS